MKSKFIQSFMKYFLSVLGFFMFILFIYVNFIRERLPRDIPFNLTEIRFYILVYICCIYLFLIKQLLYPHPIKNLLIQKIVAYIKLPVVYFDFYIKEYTRIRLYYAKIFHNDVPKLELWSHKSYLIYIYLLQIIPRIILLAIFIIDVFILNYIKIYYYFIFLTAMPIIYHYLRYSLEHILEQYILYLEQFYHKVDLIQIYSSEYDDAKELYEHTDEYSDILDDNAVAPYHNELVSIREYIQIQHEYDKKPSKSWYYEVIILAKEQTYDNYCEKYNKLISDLTEQDHIIIDHDYNIIMPKIISLHRSLTIEKDASKNVYVTFFKTIIYMGYFICWAYILYRSFHTVNDFNILLYILDKLYICIVNTTIWSPLKFVIFLTIIKKLTDKNKT